MDEQGVWQNDPSYLQYDRDDSWPINRDMLSGQDAIPEDEKLRILARVITASATSVTNQIYEEPTSARMLQARYILEMVYGQDTAKVVLAGKLMGLDPQLSKGSFVTRFGEESLRSNCSTIFFYIRKTETVQEVSCKKCRGTF